MTPRFAVKLFFVLKHHRRAEIQPACHFGQGMLRQFFHQVICLTIACSALAGLNVSAADTPKGFDPEPQLARIYGEIGAGRTTQALALTDALIEKAPNFRLAYLIRGDLLLARTRPIQALGASSGFKNEALSDLQAEAYARLAAYRARPDVAKVPSYLLQLAPEQQHALVVDSKHSRMYLFENIKGRPRFVADYYISQGRNGLFKTRQGDQRTPVGAYTITSSVPRAKLTDFYGAGALPINYPNEWDRINQNRGSGIWLHGVPSNTFSRPPWSSDGCVVLSNTDFEKLTGLVNIGVTPVVIGEDLQWVAPELVEAQRADIMRAFDVWKSDWSSMVFARYSRHYSRQFRSEGGNVDGWLAGRKRILDKQQNARIEIDQVSAVRYPGKEQMVLVEFLQRFRSNGLNSDLKKRQYWRKEGAVWRIVYEGNAA